MHDMLDKACLIIQFNPRPILIFLLTRDHILI